MVFHIFLALLLDRYLTSVNLLQGLLLLLYNWCFWKNNKVWFGTTTTACRVSLTGPLSHFGAVDRVPGHLVISSWDIMTQFGHVGSAELHDLHSTTRCGNMLNSSVCLLSC